MSSFGWLDADARRRQYMLEFVDLFRDSSTVDELGIGAIRDGLSDLLFPGTSTLHTRLRYVLFLPWLMLRVSDAGGPPNLQAAEFSRLEYKLIGSLVSGGETTGVIGERARDKLKRLPSQMYQSCLNRWGIFGANSPDTYFRRKAAIQELDRGDEDDLAYAALAAFGIDPHLPPIPPEFVAGALGATTFDLTYEEAVYLADKISESTSGSLFSHLINNRIDTDGYPWDDVIYSRLPDKFQRQVNHAYRFREFHVLAALLYNLMLADKADRAEWAENYRGALEDAQAALVEDHLTEGWDRDDFWKTVSITRPRLAEHTRSFADQWYEIVKRAADQGILVAEMPEARSLVELRERQMKGSRARLLGGPALDAWEGDSGTRRLEYRWAQARSHLNDLYRALS